MALSKLQANFLFAAMRGGGRHSADCAGQSRTANSLHSRSFVSITRHDGIFRDEFDVTRAGLEALLDYWMRKDAASGCIAYQKRRQEVEAVLASRFPEPLKLAA